jgi:hypothetical protein
MAWGFGPSVNRLVGEALVNDTLQGRIGTINVIHAQCDAVVIAEIILAEIAVKVFL